MLDVKVVGHQWYWAYEYLDHAVEIDGQPQVVRIESRYTPEDQAGEHYLRDVDNPLVLPVGKKVRFLHTSADVNHAFWVLELAVKKDAIPGYVTETWVDLNREGTFRGQCAEPLRHLALPHAHRGGVGVRGALRRLDRVAEGHHGGRRRGGVPGQGLELR